MRIPRLLVFYPFDLNHIFPTINIVPVGPTCLVTGLNGDSNRQRLREDESWFQSIPQVGKPPQRSSHTKPRQNFSSWKHTRTSALLNHTDRLQQQRDPGPLNRCPLVYHVTLLRVWARYCASRVPFALAEKTKVVGGEMEERSAWATGSHRENARPTTKAGSSGGCETTS